MDWQTPITVDHKPDFSQVHYQVPSSRNKHASIWAAIHYTCVYWCTAWRLPGLAATKTLRSTRHVFAHGGKLLNQTFVSEAGQIGLGVYRRLPAQLQ